MSKKVIMVTGGSGLVGKSMQKVIKEENPEDEEWIFLSSKDADLLDAQSTSAVFEKYKPTHVIHLAALVGGLYRHLGQNLEMMRLNLRINDHVMEACREHKCQKVVSCMSTCIFPDETTYPIEESMLHSGPPHNSNCGYAYAKRMIDVANHLYARDHGMQCTGVIPTNIYGPFDNFSLADSHVLPGLVHKCYLAQKENKPFVISGTGTPRRQFIFSEDLARLIVWTLRDYPEIDPILLSVSEDEEISIKELAELIAEAYDFKGEIIYDTSKSDGQFKKTTTNKKLKSYLPDYKFKSIKDGIQETVDWFKASYPNVRLSY
ncbi:unnamed protein product [Meganyctiphanes norvegica]|uniref:GDP-L-fucose synthase n=1 Tax=Meganyctiphanes norvegica TaxID=48144 RepID=A0AAV2S1P2_MEGNR